MSLSFKGLTLDRCLSAKLVLSYQCCDLFAVGWLVSCDVTFVIETVTGRRMIADRQISIRQQKAKRCFTLWYVIKMSTQSWPVSI